MKFFALLVFALGLLFSLHGYAAPRLDPSAASESPVTNSPAIENAEESRSLAMLFQVVRQLEYYVKTQDLSSIHNEDLILQAASVGLLMQAGSFPSSQADSFKKDYTAFCERVSGLHLAGDLAQQAQAEAALGQVRAAFERIPPYFRPQVVARARLSLETFTCPMHRDIVGHRTDFCPKCGMELDQMPRILPKNSGFPLAGQQIVKASVSCPPLTAGQPATVLLRLEKANHDPVLPSDLIETHTRKIHLLIIDASLTDYHHEHPEATRQPGEYSFSFTPGRTGSYRVWADLRPYPLGLQEYAMADLPGSVANDFPADRNSSLQATVDGLNYTLALDTPAIKVARSTSARLKITTRDGVGFTQLEPIMATFAHLVGFCEDYTTVLHLHPKGPPALDPQARGGPELEFQIYALRPGFYRLFAQVQIDGRARFIPFGITVAP